MSTRQNARSQDPAPIASPVPPDRPEATASTVIEAPQPAGRSPLDAHDFANGGGSGGAEAFSRKRLKALRHRS